MDKFKKIRLASILGIICNFFLFVIKIIGGLLFNSQAMIADAFNSFGDVFSSIMSYIGNKVASKPRDDDHNLGHGKAEYIYSLLISVIMFLVVISLIRDSVWGLLNNSKVEFSIWLIIVCVITIIIKFSLFIYTKRIAKKYNSLLLKANSKDHRNDCFLTISNLIAILFSLKNIYFVDGIVGIVIAMWILISALSIYKQSYDVLMDKAIDEETKTKVLKIIAKYPEVKKINHFNSTPIGDQYQISFSIFVDGNLTTFASHEIADRLEDEIIKEIAEINLAVIHVNPLN